MPTRNLNVASADVCHMFRGVHINECRENERKRGGVAREKEEGSREKKRRGRERKRGGVVREKEEGS